MNPPTRAELKRILNIGATTRNKNKTMNIINISDYNILTKLTQNILTGKKEYAPRK